MRRVWSRYERVFFWMSVKAVLVAFLFQYGYWDLGPGVFYGGLGFGSGPTVGFFWESHCRGMAYVGIYATKEEAVAARAEKVRDLKGETI